MAGSRPEDTPELETRARRTLSNLPITAGRTLDPAELVRLVAEHASDLLHGDAVAVYLWDDAASVLVPVFSNDPRLPTQDQPLRLGQGAAGQAVLRRKPVVVDDYQHWEDAVAWGVARDLQAVVAVPLLVADWPVGALIVRFYDPTRTLGEDLERTLPVLAAQVAPALEAARLYATTSLQREHERALREITQALAANLDEREVLDLAVHFGAELLKAPYARIWLLEPNGELKCAAAEGFVHPQTFTRRLSRESTSGRVARQNVVNLNNAPAEPSWRVNRKFGERTGLGAYLGAGLWRAGQSLGVIEVMRQTGHRFSDVEEQLLVSLANAVAVAVSNARAHAEIEESELMLRSVYEAIGSGVIVFDGRGAIVTANAAAADILGRPIVELLGMRSEEFLPGLREDGSPLPPDERPFPRAVGARGAVRKYAFGITRPDGQLRWLQADAVPVLTAAGEVMRVIASFIDITEQKLAAEALHQRDAILEAVAFAAERLLSAAEWEHSIEDVLRQLGQAAGVSRVYIVPTCVDGVPDSNAYEWRAEGVGPRPAAQPDRSYLETIGLGRWEPVLREGSAIQGRVRSFPPDEQAVLAALGVCSTVVVPIFAAETWWGFIGFDDCAEERSWPVGIVEVLKTAAGTLGAAILRRRADAERLQLAGEQMARAEAEAAQRRLAFLAEASQILAGSLDFEPTLQGVADLVVATMADCCLVDVREPDGVVRRIAFAVAAPLAEHVRDLLAAEDPARTVSAPLVTRSGNAGAITWLVSAKRPPFGMHAVQLAHDVARRCALAIDNARLYREARAAISIRDEFMSVAAHELKTPMTSLRGYAQLLGREFDKHETVNPERVRRAVTTIQVQSDKLARLIGQLLDISRIQSGKLAIERKPSDLTVLVKDVVESARTQLKHHTLIARLPDELLAFIDPLRIEQVITNLVDNAIKYSPEGGRIDVALGVVGDTARLTVRDHGAGVRLEHRAHIFDRFYQAHTGGPLTSMAGMGLGLYISREIVELHGGEIGAEFPDEGGTVFFFRLPIQ